MENTNGSNSSDQPTRIAETPAYELLHLDDSNAQWDWFERYLGAAAVKRSFGPLSRVLTIARKHGCTSVVVEKRYVDLDYRSEYSLFWSKRFEDKPAFARRVHFFGRRLEADEVLALPADAGYIGYSVIRPTTLGPVGRTILRPPDGIPGDEGMLCTVTDRPSLFGQGLEIEGSPFCQQDGELLCCAHAAAWLCHYVAQERGLIGRRTTAEIAQLPSPDGSRHRPQPSYGLTSEQMQSIFTALHLPAVFYDGNDLPEPPAALPRTHGMEEDAWEAEVERERLLRIACKYVNSGYPVVVLTEGRAGEENHAFTIVGWKRTDDGHVSLVSNDDQIGPYEEIGDVLSEQERNGRWVGIMVPLPEKVFLTGEAAEQNAWIIAEGASKLTERNGPQEEDFGQLEGKLDNLRDGLSVRTQMMSCTEFKERLKTQDRGDDATRLYQMAHLPHWVWVVELHDRDARAAGQPCVVAEIVFDSTSHDDAPLTVLATTASQAKDHGALRRGNEEPTAASGPSGRWRSMIVGAQDDPELAAATAVA